VRSAAALQSLSSSLATSLAGALSGVLIARALGPADRGVLAALTALPFLVMTLATMGADDAVARFVGRGLLEPAAASRIVWRRFVVWGLVVAVLIWPVQVFVVLDGRFTGAATVIVLLAPAFMVSRMLNGLVLGQSRFGPWNVLRSVGGLVYCSAVLACYLLDRLSVAAVVLAWLLSYAVSVAAASLLTRTSWGAGSSPAPRALYPILKYATRVGLTKAGSQLTQKADQVALSMMVPAHELGVYVVAATVSLSPGAVIIGYSSYVFASCARLPPEKRKRSLLRFAGWGWLLSLGVYLLIWLAAPWILAAGFGAEFTGGTGLTRIMCVSAFLFYGSLTTVSILNAEDRAGRATMAQLACLAITVIGVPVLIHLGGTPGAAYAVAIANGVNALLVLWALARLIGEPVADSRRALTPIKEEAYL
jgi:O-antigen/teichoic acid export membrane protein